MHVSIAAGLIIMCSAVQSRHWPHLNTAALLPRTKSSRSSTNGRGRVGAFSHFNMPSLAACSLGISGNSSGINGNSSGISGNSSGISGNSSGFSGNSSGINGSSSGINGNSSGISGNQEERAQRGPLVLSLTDAEGLMISSDSCAMYKTLHADQYAI